MDAKKPGPTTTDEYIAQCPEEVQPILHQIRATIRKAAPEASEKIGYGMPGFYQNGALVWFACHEHYIGLYPTGEGIEAFKNELSPWKSSKGAVQFPLGQPMPHELITQIVKHRVAENQKKAQK